MKRTLSLGSLTAIALAVVYIGCMEGSESGDDLCCDGSGDVWRPDVSADGRDYASADADADADADSSWEMYRDTGRDASDADARADAAADSTIPDVPPEVAEAAADVPEAIEDVPDAEVSGVCLREILEPQVLYLSADDSNSQASPVIARRLIREGHVVRKDLIRTYEFLNYYEMSYAFPERGRVRVVPQMRADLDLGGRVTMQIGVQGHEMTDETRRPVSLTLCLDRSGSMGERMTSGLMPIDLEREVVRAIAASLRLGDIVSAVTWDDSLAIRLDSYRVTGPSDPTIIALADSLTPGGSTNLDAGLSTAYGLADRNYRAGALNRVVLVSDGQANTGVVSEELIAGHAVDAEGEGIYLVGVGTGNGYNDTLMDTVTDRGKGAYVFIDTPAEAEDQFVDHFYRNMEIAVKDVRVQLTLPPQLRMEEFHGEEISTDPAEVEPQHLAPNDAMIFHQYLQRCPGLADLDAIRVVAEYTEPSSGLRRSDAVDTTVAQLLEGSGTQLYKGNAIVLYAEGLKDIYNALHTTGTAAATEICTGVLAQVQAAADLLRDPEIDEIRDLLAAYCPTLGTRSDVW